MSILLKKSRKIQHFDLWLLIMNEYNENLLKMIDESVCVDLKRWDLFISLKISKIFLFNECFCYSK